MRPVLSLVSLVVFAALLAPAGAAPAGAARPKLAVLDLVAIEPVKQPEAEQLTDIIRSVAVRKLPGYDVLTKENILVVLKANNKKLSECEGECEVETGRLIGADVIVSGTIGQLGTTFLVNLRVHGTAEGQMLAGRTARAPTLDELIAAIEESSGLALNAVPGAVYAASAPAAPAPTPAATPVSAPPVAPASAPPVVAEAPPAPPGMVRLAEGNFTIGSDSGESDERPARRVWLDTFFMDRNEVTVADFERCVSAGVCSRSTFDTSSRSYCNYGAAGRGDHPMNCVDWRGADQYCRFAGKRLPTEAEWERAARGAEGRTFPWGEAAPDCDRVVMKNSVNDGCGEDRTFPVGSKPRGATPEGIQDLAGNVWEWLADYYEPNGYASLAERNPQGPTSGSRRGMRGSSWLASGPSGLRGMNRDSDTLEYKGNGVGFRCVQSAGPGGPTVASPPVVAEAPLAPSGMVRLGEGTFTIGNDAGESDERPARRVWLDAFYLDRTEVTVGDFERCVSAGACSRSTFETSSRSYCNFGAAGRSDHPMNCVDWRGAEQYCRFAGKRLPTEAEWERAARGAENRTFPWGEAAPDCDRVVMKNSVNDGCGEDRTFAVGSKPRGATPEGILDLAGNVWEWIADFYEPNGYASLGERNPQGPTAGSRRGMRGSSWLANGPSGLRTFNRESDVIEYKGNGVGFRCAQSAR